MSAGWYILTSCSDPFICVFLEQRSSVAESEPFVVSLSSSDSTIVYESCLQQVYGYATTLCKSR